MAHMHKQFAWFFGVVEDRDDPLQIGRVRVRAFGWHTGVLEDLPTEDLPWAQPIQGITSAATSGIGHSPTGLLEGTWVMGFYADGDHGQRPYIMGSLGGIPQAESTPDEGGFQDPNNKYPLFDRLGEPDTSRLARHEAENAPSLIARRNSRTQSIPVAIASWANSAANTISAMKGKGGSYPYLRTTWTEVNPRYDGESDYSNLIASQYPFNHVYQGESGIIREHDETPGNTRINEHHPSGTFYEIQNSGTKTTKVVGDNYEIIAGKNKVFIAGTCDITIQGNVNILHQGDLRHEVDGDYYLTIKGDRITKIQGNDVKEVMSDESTQINGNKNERVSKEKREITDFSFTETVGNNHISTVKKNRRISIFHNLAETVTANTTFITIKNFDLGAGVNLNIGAAENLNLRAKDGFGTLQTGTTYIETVGTKKTSTTGTDWDHTSTDDVTVIGQRIDLNP